MIARTPRCVREMALRGYGTRRDKELEQKVNASGFGKAKYRP
ncbi:MAG TPA: hypothetical protein VN678_05030 [Acidobacteriaceae bacterium]|nr:hypothetical protein [Acidobacteriaceae bacterium]